MVAGAGCKLALSIATNTTVLCMLYGCMMGNYDTLYLPMMVLGYVFSVPFFLLTVRPARRKARRPAWCATSTIALVMYVGVLILLFLWNPNDPNFMFSIYQGTLFESISQSPSTPTPSCSSSSSASATAPTTPPPRYAHPMVADCSDYETYRSGNYIPGIMGTLFSLVDKQVSSLSATVVGLAVSAIGLSKLPTQYTRMRTA